MKSALPKVLHEVGGRPMIAHVLAAAEALSPAKVVVVVAPGMERVAAAVAPHATAVQDRPLGTANALLAAETAQPRRSPPAPTYWCSTATGR